MADPSVPAGGAPPAGSSAAAPHSLVGRLVAGRYQVESVLGQGGMGEVYLVRHTVMRKRLALKLLRSEISHVKEFAARFEREAMAAANIDHPHVAAATDCGKTEDGTLFLALEYVEGQSLRQALASGPLPLTRALHIVRQVASALVRAHELGIVHRDLKPDKVPIERKPQRIVPWRGAVLANHGLRCGTINSWALDAHRTPRPVDSIIEEGDCFHTFGHVSHPQPLGGAPC